MDIALEFKGGTIITYSYEGEAVDKSAISSELTDLIGTSVNVQDGESLDGGSKTLTLSFTSNEGLTVDRQAQVTDAIQSRYPDANVQLLDSMMSVHVLVVTSLQNVSLQRFLQQSS